jgi:CheY-like chemotaxis protein
MSGRAGQKGLRLELDYPPEVPSRLVGDAGRLRQVLLNLVGNAIKFTSEGSVRLWVRSESSDDGRTTLRVHVTDTGIGIPAAKIDQLFQPFVQADSSMARRFGGTGLGLAISRRLVELMRGTMGVESEEGRGSTFWFAATLPVHPRRVLRVRAPRVLAGVRALIGDADAASAASVGAWLAAWGATPVVATSVTELVTAAREATDRGEPFGLVLVDERLGTQEPEALVRTLRTNGLDASARVLIAGGGGRIRDEERLEGAGANGWLARPWRAATLASLCELVLTPGATHGFVTRESAAAVLAPAEPGGTPVPSIEDALLMLSGPPPLNGTRVLLVEDNLTNQRVAQRLLERAGCLVTVAGNGVEAVECFRTHPFDIVFMDCQMPEMDGYEATRAIRELESDGARAPIVALTANAMEGDRERCLAAGMDDFVSKPIRREVLLGSIERWRGRPGTARAA